MKALYDFSYNTPVGTKIQVTVSLPLPCGEGPGGWVTSHS